MSTLKLELNDTVLSLARLDLSHNDLAALPDALWRLEQLVHLDLSWNCLESLPPEVGRLAKLEELSIGVNRLTELPAEVPPPPPPSPPFPARGCDPHLIIHRRVLLDSWARSRF